MTLDLTDDEVRTIAKPCAAPFDDPFPLVPWLDPLKTILVKLEPPLWLASDRSYNRGRAVLSTHRG